MKVEQVRLKKTLKCGENVWVEGSYFPNDQYPSIPSDILLEVALNTGTVEVTKQSEEDPIVFPKTVEELSSTFADVETSTPDRATLEEALQEEKRQINAAELPFKPKRKSKLVRR